MSTKINVRSPFYLNLTEPVAPLPLYDCNVAFPSGSTTGFAIDNQGVITDPTPVVGTVFSRTSSDGDFSNDKFAVENSDTSRTVIYTLNIPTGFSNSSDVYLTCTQTTTQPGTGASGGTAVIAPCTGGPTTSGSIPAQSLAVDGATVDIDLSGYFAGETTYAINNTSPLIVTTALSGSTLTLTTNNIGGTATLYAIGRDGSYPTTCEAAQPIALTVTTPDAWSCTSPVNPALSGGSIAANGDITRPSSAATIQGVSLTDGGALLSPENTGSANTGSASRNITLFFKMLVPNGYSNAAASIFCSSTLVQAGTTAATYTCAIAALTGQQISKNGSISLGSTAQDDSSNKYVKSFTPPSPALTTVATDTTHNIEYQVIIPPTFNGANGTATINCTVPVIQPASVSICGTHQFFLSIGRNDLSDFDNAVYVTSNQITSTEGNLKSGAGAQICKNGNAFDGQNKYYAIFGGSSTIGGAGGGDFYVYLINSDGIVTNVHLKNQGGSIAV
jgi:hypothetical protein